MYHDRLQLPVIGLLAVILGASSFLVVTTKAVAQSSGRDSRSDSDRRERWRRDRGGESGREGGRDGGSRGRDDEHRREDRSSSSSSGGSSRSSSSGSSSSSTNSAVSKPASSSSSSSSLSTAEYAKSFIRGKDKDKNGWLNGDELKDLTGKPADADLNKDGTITVEELTARLSSDTPTTPSTTSGSSSSKSDSDRHDDHKKGDADLSKRVLYGSISGASSSSKEAEKRHTYRFSRATDKLPSGLPDWFKSKDANRDGQVSMSEYSRTWSKSTVSDFRKYDKNDDGIVTAKELVKPENKGG
jgi:Ca2+-binding EF-hand superfamily protein